MKRQSTTRGIGGACLVWFLVTLCYLVTARAQELSFCEFHLSKAIRQANTTFNVIYVFDVSEKGIPINIRAVRKGFARQADVRACLKRWRLPQLGSKHLIAVFEWHHGVGWTKLAISGPDVDLTIHLTGERCPYGANASEKIKSTAATHRPAPTTAQSSMHF